MRTHAIQRCLRRRQRLAVPSHRLRARTLSFGRATGRPQPPLPPPPSPLLEGSSVVVPWLIGCNCAVYGLWGVPALHEWLHTHFALSAESMQQGRYHTLLTSTFSHYQPGHLLSNMVMLYIFGRELPRSLGTMPFLGLYLAA